MPAKSPLLKNSIHFAFTASISAFWANAGAIEPAISAIAKAIPRMDAASSPWTSQLAAQRKYRYFNTLYIRHQTRGSSKIAAARDAIQRSQSGRVRGRDGRGPPARSRGG